MKVLLNDGLDRDGIRLFGEAGIEVDANKRDPDQLTKDIADFDALVVRSSTKVTEEVIEAGARGKLKIIGRAGVGYDNIDVETASKLGILVKFAPHGNTNATAELAFALILAISRNIHSAHHSLKSGVWKKKPYKGVELSHKTLGILGCGRIGQRLAELSRGFDMEVIGYDAMPDRVRALFPDSRIKYVPKEDVLKKADYVSIHTGGKDIVVGEKELTMMKPTAYLVNVSRGGNVDNEALYTAIKNSVIAGAGLDTYENEPKKEDSDFNHKLAELDAVVLSSHLGASTEEAQRKTSIEMASAIIDFLKQGDFTGSVNADASIESESKPCHSLFINHKDVPGVFAKIDQLLAEHSINIRENQSRQLGPGGLVLTVYLVDQEISPDVLKAINMLEMVISAKS